MMEEGRAGPSHGQSPNAELLLGPDPQHARPHKADCFDYFCR